jgi:hypothetical protein
VASKLGAVRFPVVVAASTQPGLVAAKVHVSTVRGAYRQLRTRLSVADTSKLATLLSRIESSALGKGRDFVVSGW